MLTLLINPVERDFMPPSVFPLGLAYVVAALEKDGYVVRVLDINVRREKWQYTLASVLEQTVFDWIGISSIITQYKQVKEIGQLIRCHAPNTVLVHGGPGPTSIPGIFLDKAEGDFVVVGEGEGTTVGLARVLESGGDPADCRGLLLPGELQHVSTGPRVVLEDLDDVPFPAWKHFDVDEYAANNLYTPEGAGPGMNIITSRGCPGRCTYCMRNFGNATRFRSVDNIMNEIEQLRSRYGIRHVHFVDDTIATNADRLSALCAEVKRAGGLSWSANARVTQVSPGLLREMGESGCQYISYGIESASPGILKEMRKGITVKRASDAIRWTREAGVQPRGYFMIGFPSENAWSIRDSVEFCKENLVGGEFFFLTPFPGTEVWDNAVVRGLIRDFDVYLEVAGEVRNFVVNMTRGLDNDTLFRLKIEAEEEIRTHLCSQGIEVRESHRKDPWESAYSLPRFS